MKIVKKWTESEFRKVNLMRKNGRSFQEIASALGRTPASVSCAFREISRGDRVPAKKANNDSWQADIYTEEDSDILIGKSLPAKKEVDSSGSMFTEALLSKGTVEAAAEKFNVDLKIWEAKKIITNEWSMGYTVRKKDGEAIGKRLPLFQVKVWWEKKQIPLDKFEDLIAEVKKNAFDLPPAYKKQNKNKNGRLLVVDLADIHFNKLALCEETGDDYDLSIARQRCIEGVEKILEEVSVYPIEKIILVGGNDALHTDDSMSHSTTSGTAQDSQTRWWAAFRFAKTTYIDIINRLLLEAPVEYIFCSSNHDRTSGFFLAECLEAWFSKVDDATFIVNPGVRTYRQYGKNLLGFEHGDGIKKIEKHYDMMASSEPRMWADTKFRYLYLHHIHHKERAIFMTKDYQGITIESLRSPSGSDSWHAAKGFVQKPAVECFIHDKEKGQTSRHTIYF